MVAATSLVGVVGLISKAEDLLISNANQANPADRVCTLRGIYYGTEWSLDYKTERSKVRNLGFITYTGGNVPADPRPALAGTTLFDDLQKSQYIKDHNRSIDIGHMLIGIETRSSIIMRNLKIAGQGGSGLEIVTWLGDLGGGAASLAKSRITNAKQSVERVFNNKKSDYGATENLEGDIAGYLVACDKNPGGEPAYGIGKSVSYVITEYLPIKNAVQWETRAARFATAIGGSVGTTGIANAGDLVSTLTDKIHDFAVWYAVTRWIPSGELHGSAVQKFCTHLRGASKEVATVFVTALSSAVADKKLPVIARAPYPLPSAPSACTSSVLDAASKDPSSIRKSLDEWRKNLTDLFK